MFTSFRLYVVVKTFFQTLLCKYSWQLPIASLEGWIHYIGCSYKSWVDIFGGIIETALVYGWKWDVRVVGGWRWLPLDVPGMRMPPTPPERSSSVMPTTSLTTGSGTTGRSPTMPSTYSAIEVPFPHPKSQVNQYESSQLVHNLVKKKWHHLFTDCSRVKVQLVTVG